MNERTSGNKRAIDNGVRIGHVHLKVADLERALDFYCDVLGFRITQRYGASAVFIAAGDYHHHIGLNTWESAGESAPPIRSTGLYHLAILYPTRALLADAYRRLVDAGIPLEGASDHGVSEALYLRDPDKNGVELYWDKPREQWPVTGDGQLQMYSRRLDLEDLWREVDRHEEPPSSDNSNARLLALDRWENEGGASHGDSARDTPNPEVIHEVGPTPSDPPDSL